MDALSLEVPARPVTVAAQARAALTAQPTLPLPGSGQTLARWRHLAALGAQDLCVAKILEAHYDAHAILADLAVPTPVSDGLIAVWAAEGPTCTLRADGDGRLHGDKPWCSGSGVVDSALVTVRSPAGGQLYLVAGHLAQALPDAGRQAPGMAGVRSPTVRFHQAPATCVGGVDAYLQRPGFWHGGAGIAAVWYGAAAALATRMQPACREGLRARLLGKADLALAPAAALLRELAARIDAQPDHAHRDEVIRARSVVERAATRVLDLAGRTLGPGPMCQEVEHAQRWSDLTVFLRQSHADRDWEALGSAQSGKEDAWTL